MFAQHPKSLALGQIIDNTRASSTCLRAVVEIFWSLHDAQSRRFGCPRLPLAAAAQARTVWILSGTAADVNVVNLHRAGQRLLARDQKTEGMTHTPCGRLADPDRLGQPNRGDAFVRLQDEPKPREPNAERQLGGMQRGARGNGELRAALAARALIEARARLPALITPGQRDRLPKSACWTDPAAWPDHSFHEPTTLILVRKRFNHVTDGRNLRQARARIVGHRVLPADHQAHHGQVQGRVQGDCCLWLIKATYAKGCPRRRFWRSGGLIRRILVRFRYGMPLYCVQSWRAIDIGRNVSISAGVLHAANGGSNAGDNIACNTRIGRRLSLSGRV